jgi:hypothetical protein
MRSLCVAALVVAGSSLPPAACPAEDAADDATGARTLEFKRVHVPADRLSEVPLGPGRYVPMSAREFEEGIARLSPGPRASGREGVLAAAPAADVARYDVALSADGELSGEVSFDIGSFVDAPRARTVARELPLGGLDVRTGSMRTASGTGAATIFGRQGQGTSIATPEPGTYTCPFRLPTEVGGDSHRRVVLPLVPALSSTVVLRLPPGVRPVVPAGAASRVVAAIDAEAGEEAEAGEKDGPAAVAWRIETGPRDSLDVMLVPDNAVERRLTGWTSIDIRGREASIALGVRPVSPWLPVPLQLRKDPDVIVTSVALGDHASRDEAAWRLVDDGRGLVVDLPGHWCGSRQPLVVTAVAPLGPGGGRLPLVRIEDAEWGGGGIALRVETPLALESIDAENALVVPPEAAARWPLVVTAPLGGGPRSDGVALPAAAAWPDVVAEDGVVPARVYVEEQSPSASVTVTLTPRAAVLDVARVTAVDLSQGIVVARTTCDMQVLRGEAFDLTARITPGWFIDSVESTGPAAGGEAGEGTRRRDSADVGVGLDWKVQRDAGGDVLRVGLTVAATPVQGLGLRITGHRGGIALGEDFSTQALDMLRFDGESERSALLEFRTSPDMTVEFDGGEQPAVAADARLAPLVEEGSVRARMWAGHRSASRTARLVRRRPPLDVRTQVRLTVRDDRLTESFTFECQPGGSDLDAFVVSFSEPLDAPLEWSLIPPATGIVSARRLDPADGRAGQPAAAIRGERWLVELVPAARGTVTVRGGRTVPFVRTTPVPLAWVEAATTDGGQVFVRDVGRSRLQIVNRRLDEVAPDPQAEEGGAATVWEFTYGLGAAAGDDAVPAAELLPSGDARGWAWRQIDSSWCHASGATEYETTIDVENKGRPAVSLSLPSGRRVQSVVVDGARVPLGDRRAAGGDLRLELPAGRQFVTIVVRAVADPPADRGLLPGLLDSLTGGHPAFWTVEPAAIGIDVPVLQREWRLFLPPGIDIATVGGGWRVVGDRRASRAWSTRLLGADVRAMSGSPVTATTGSSLRGFHCLQIVPSASSDVDAGVVVVRTQLLAVVAVLAGIAAAWTVVLAARLGSWPALLLCLISGVAALWSAPPVDGVARAMWWAAVGTAVLTRASGWWPTCRAATSPVVGGAAALAIAVGVAATGRAQEATPAGAAAPPPLQVFITPTDGRERDAAAEPLALVPEELFRILVRGEDVATIAPVRVLATRIAARAASDADAVWGAWRLALDVDADDGATLVLDQSAVGGRFSAARAVIDGVPTECRLEGGGARLRIAIPQAGRHAVEVDVDPAIQRRGETESATIAVPASPTATLEMAGAPDRSGVICERLTTGRGMFVLAATTVGGGAAATAYDVSRSTQVRLVRSLVPGVGFATQPRTVVSRNDVVWSLDGCLVTATFDVEPGDAIVRSVEVVADPGLEVVTAADARGDDAETADGVAIRRVGDRRFLVERKSPDRGRMRFEMAFRMRLDDPAGVFDVPAAWLDRAGVDMRTVRFSANPSLTVRVDLPAGLAVASIPDGEPSFDIRSWREEVLHPLQRPVAVAASEPPAAGRPRARLWVERRRQEIRGSQRLAVTFAADAVRLQLDARLDASSTALVTIPLELPAGCVIDRVTLVEDDALPPEATGRGAIDVHWTLTDETSAKVVVQQPRAGRFRLDVDARIPGRPTAAGRFPCLRAALAAESRTLVDWRVEDGRLVRLQRAAAGGGIPGEDSVPRATGQFERPAHGGMPEYVLEVPPPGEASRRSDAGGEERPAGPGSAADQQPAGEGRVELADIRLAVDERGRAWGLARFEMIAADRVVRLRLPPSWRLFDVSVDGRPMEGVVPVVPQDDNVWEFRLLDQGWPRSVVVLFAGDLGRRLVDGKPFALASPDIVGLPCRQVVWTLDVPAWIALRVQEPARIVAADRLLAERRAALGRLAEDFEQSLARLPPPARERLQRFFEARRDESPRAVAPAPWRGFSPTSAGFPAAEPVMIAGGDGRLTVRGVRRPDPTTRGRAVATLSLLAGFAVAWFAGRRGWPAWMASRSPWRWAAAAAGAAWIFCLTPTWPGVVLAMAAVASLAADWLWSHGGRASRRAAPSAGGVPGRSSAESTTRLALGEDDA